MTTVGGRGAWWRLAASVSGVVALSDAVPAAIHRPSAAPRRHLVVIEGMSFRPLELGVAPGDTVVWINRDIVQHTATGIAPARWDTGPLGTGERGSVVIRERGKTRYRCALHPTMEATVVAR